MNVNEILNKTQASLKMAVKAVKQQIEFYTQKINRAHLYRRVFLSTDGAGILKDLDNFCSNQILKDSNGRIDPMQLAIIQGKQEVYRYILRTAKITNEEINEMYTNINHLKEQI